MGSQCYVLQTTRVNSHDLTAQGTGPALPVQNPSSRFKSYFFPNNHHTQDFQLLIPHRQNPHRDQPAWLTAKIFSQCGIQLCVTSVAVQSWQTDFHGLHERPPWVVQHSGLVWTHIILVIHKRLKKYTSYIMLHWTSHQAHKCGCEIKHSKWSDFSDDCQILR
jgi:hypothetical protein